MIATRWVTSLAGTGFTPVGIIDLARPHTPLIYYLQHQWPQLIGYLDNEHYPIDNNVAENAIRPFVIGRKNWLFSTSQADTKASANLYGLIETAKANDLNPYDYLKHAFKAPPNAHAVEDIENLLPWNYKITS